MDSRDAKMGAKIREAQLKKINYMLILGENEKENKNISIRKRNGENVNDADLNSFIKDLHDEIKTKRIGD